MNDLISRKALLAEYDRVHIGPPGGARKLMEDAPAVDAVPVIRCKDCDHGSHVDTPEGRVWCEKMCRYMVFEGYCSYGKRRSNEQT